MTVNNNSNNVQVERTACARIPTKQGEFQLCHYSNTQDNKEHLALVSGDVSGKSDVLVRVHSECFTGDVLGSLRCDCGPQLQRSLELIGGEESGVIIYLRQEGRNIGLLDKLRAYNLQDAGYDTVDANLMLGHQADNRNYIIAALILEELGVSSIRLLTNNPRKIEEIRDHGIDVTSRIPIQAGINYENIEYLATKANKMRHMLDLDQLAMPQERIAAERPFVTLSYAQSLDGSIAAKRGEPLILSGSESMMMTHRLRADHDAILVGIETVLADDPLLTVRLVDGRNPIPVVLDSHLRFPLSARLLQDGNTPWIATIDDEQETAGCVLIKTGARIMRLPANDAGRVDLRALLSTLLEQGIESVMVEGGARVITSFLTEGLADRLVLTIVPDIIGGVAAVDHSVLNGAPRFPRLKQSTFRQLGNDIVVIGDFVTE